MSEHTNSFTRRSLIRAGIATPLAVGAVGATTITMAMADGTPAPKNGETEVVNQELHSAEEVPGNGASEANPELDGETARNVAGYITMAGASWSGETPDAVEFQGIDLDGTPGEWLAAELMDDAGLKATDAVWLGECSAVNVRAFRDGQDISSEMTLKAIATSPAPNDNVTTGGKGTAFFRPLHTSYKPGTHAPDVISRKEWGADESLVKDTRTYRDQTKSVVLHHTAGTNNYTMAQVPQILRGILSYHTTGNGWADIGYNVLVDKYGRVFEGRAGGLERNVQGAHAYGFNSETFGISVLGDYTSVSAPSSTLQAISSIAAWKLNGVFVRGVHESVTFTGIAKSPRIKFNTSTASLTRFFTHRDVNYTSCPGDTLYGQVDRIKTLTATHMSKQSHTHLDAYYAAGGDSVLGTVTHIETAADSYSVTRLTKGLVITNGKSTKAYKSIFGADWQSSWGLPLESTTGTTQRFENGTAHKVNGKVTFTKTAASRIGFTDISATYTYYNELIALQKLGIIAPYGDGSFRPRSRITRVAFAQMLYDASGEPKVSVPKSSPFTDVNPNDFGYKALVWCYQTGKNKGWKKSDGKYEWRPGLAISRRAAAQFMYSVAGASVPAPKTAVYNDVPAKARFAREISWFKQLRIVRSKNFNPLTDLSRSDAAVFIYRWLEYTGNIS